MQYPLCTFLFRTQLCRNTLQLSTLSLLNSKLREILFVFLDLPQIILMHLLSPFMLCLLLCHDLIILLNTLCNLRIERLFASPQIRFLCQVCINHLIQLLTQCITLLCKFLYSRVMIFTVELLLLLRTILKLSYLLSVCRIDLLNLSLKLITLIRETLHLLLTGFLLCFQSRLEILTLLLLLLLFSLDSGDEVLPDHTSPTRQPTAGVPPHDMSAKGCECQDGQGQARTWSSPPQPS